MALGYLLGSIPFGLFFTWLSGAGDVRKIGSGNIGATNVLRTGKKWAAAATLLCDGAKGAAAVLLARAFSDARRGDLRRRSARCWAICFPSGWASRAAKAWPPFSASAWRSTGRWGLLVAATWLVAALVWRISSLSALIAIALSPLYFLLFGQRRYAAAGAAAGRC